MACFLVPMVEAIGISTVQMSVKKEISKRWKINWLRNMLWGGVSALAIEHALHGEIVWWPPFLTAMQNSQEIGPMLYEMGVIGIPMSLAITVVWAVMVAIVRREERKVIVAEASV